MQVLAVGVLFVLSKCVQDTKALDNLFRLALGSPTTVQAAQIRLIVRARRGSRRRTLLLAGR